MRHLNRIGTDLSLAAVSHGIEKGIALVVIAVLVRHVDKVSMGQFFFAISVCGLVAMLTELGTSRHLVRTVAQDTAHAAEYLQQVLRLRLPLLLIALVLVNATVALVAPSMLVIFLLSSIYVLAGDLYYAFGATLLGLRAVAARCATGLVGSFILLVLVPLATWLQWQLEQILLAYALSSLLMTGLAWRVTMRRIGHGGGVAALGLRELLGRSLPLFTLSLLMLAHARTDELMLAGLRGFAEVASYAVAYKLVEVSRFIIRPLTMVLFPVLSAKLGEQSPVRYRHDVRRLVAYSALAGVLVALVVIPLAPIVVPWLFGAGYQDTVLLTQVVFLVTPALFAGYTAMTVANALQIDRAAIMVVATGVVANIALNSLVIPQWGAIGAACITVVTELLMAAGLMLVIERNLRISIGRQADTELSPGAAR